MALEYAFLTHWRVKGTAEEVFDVLADPLALSRWWPSVYLDVKELKPGDPVTRVGRVNDLYTKGWLPYTLRWNSTVTESKRPGGFKLVAHGDFEATGVWTITRDGDHAGATYDWRISAEKPLLRYGSFILRPSSPPTTEGRWRAARRAWTWSCAACVRRRCRRRQDRHSCTT